jgi:hypothetical protein
VRSPYLPFPSPHPSAVSCICSPPQYDERHAPNRPHSRVTKATYPSSFNQADAHVRDSAPTRKSTPNRKTTAHSSTLNNKPAAAREQQQSKQPHTPFFQPPYCTYGSHLNQPVNMLLSSLNHNPTNPTTALISDSTMPNILPEELADDTSPA